MSFSRKSSRLSRRQALRLGAAASAAGVLAASAPRALALGEPLDAPTLRNVPPSERKLLFVFCAYGGASIIDSFMPVVDYEVPNPLESMSLNTWPGWGIEQVAGSAFRVPALLDNYGVYYEKPSYSIADFVRAHGADVAVIGHDVSSVNHSVGQHRALTGAGIDRGRTLMEAMALRYGGGLSLPSTNMAMDGYLVHGADSVVPAQAKHEPISNPLLFATGTHGYQGVAGAPSAALIERARAAREQLESRSIFGRTFARDTRRGAFLQSRERNAPGLEGADLFAKLLLADVGGDAGDPFTAQLKAGFSHLETDTLEAQTLLSFLLAYHGMSTSLTFGHLTDPFFGETGKALGAPIAFDFSHNTHRETQSLMWSRTLLALDQLISLLKAHDYLGDPSLGKMWDRSLIYVATEFGRSKTRPALSSSWGSGHDLNNGSLLISPLVKGNKIYGGVDPSTLLTYGFDPESGDPEPGRRMSETDVYGIISQALDLDTQTTTRYPGIVRG